MATAVAAGLLLSLAAAVPAQARVEQPGVLTTEPFGFGPTKIHLITGHEVEITRSLDGRYQVDVPKLPEGADQASDFEIRAKEVPGQAPEFVAEPPGTAGLVLDGLVDPRLFDLTHLVEHGYAGAATPVTVYFTGLADADAVAAAAAALPGGQFVPGSATADRATVAVPAASATTFWDAVTDPASGYPARYAPRALATGIAGLTLNGAVMSEPTTPNATLPTVKLTIRIHASKDRTRWYDDRNPVVLPQASLIPVTGVGEFIRTDPVAVCETPECQVMAITVDVPEGAWYLDVEARQRHYNTVEYIDFHEPEVVVDGDTTVDLRVDDAIWVEPETEKPNELAFLTSTRQRTRPDGTRVTNLTFTYGDRRTHGRWIAPSQYPATTGAFNVVNTHVLQQPRVRVSVPIPGEDLELLAQYDMHRIPDEVPWSAGGDTYPLVDGGYLTADRLDDLDVRGKLVLLAWAPDAPDCAIAAEPFERARAAGAVGVIFDNNDDHMRNKLGFCAFPTALPLPGLPAIAVPREDAAALRGLLAQRPVSLKVSGPETQRPDYVYTLGYHFVGGVPAQIDQSFRDRELVTRQSRLHGTAGLGWRPGDPGDNGRATNIGMVLGPRVDAMNIVGGANFWTIGASDDAVDLTHHIGPTSPDVTWGRTWQTSVGTESTRDVFPTAGRRDEVWLARPTALGPSAPGRHCNFCRLDNVLFPQVERVSGADPRHVLPGSLLGAQLVDAAGNSIPVSTVHRLSAYVLPPEPQRYTLRGTDSAGVQYEWTFNSGTAGDNRPAGTTCIQEMYFGEPCGEPVPMIYLRHAASVDIDNTAPAGGWQEVGVTALHHMPNAPQITSVTTEVSFDGGQTWHATRAIRHRDGTQTVTFQVPALANTNGHVSLRTTAGDTAGNSTVQTTVDAYALR
ncbi:MAG TPA: PA domain-containing protein [Micromonospora sp.]